MLFALVPLVALAADPTVAGAVTTPYPTYENLSVEWAITGDDDADGVVTVRYRAMGASAWRTGLPLRRVPAGMAEGFSWANKHSGSVFDLVPGTTYELELTLTDPDGGNDVRTVTATTRQLPSPAPNAVVRRVTPATIGAALSAANPGDVILLGDGTYAPITVTRNGAAGAQHLWLKAENTHQAIVNGEVRLDGRAFWVVEGLRVNAQVKFNNAHDIVVSRNVIQTAGSGVVAYDTTTGTAVYNITVIDNDITGSTTFSNATVGANGNNLGEGIELTGAGNVIAWNRVRGFRDCISTLEDASAHNQTSLDIIGNDLEIGADDAIEADFTMGNARILRNRIRNSFVGISGQPTLGGPTYAVRNVMFNVIYSPFKLHRGSVGDVALHNTVVKTGDALAIYSGVPWQRSYFRNNLFLGGTGGGTYGGFGNGTGRILELAQSGAACSYDYDGLGSIGTGSFQGRVGSATFTSLATLRSNTTEVHAQQVDLSVFAQSVTFPSSPFPEAMMPDLRLAMMSPAVDTGLALPGINDGAMGAGPDLGAYEVGAGLPTYGPRPVMAMAVCGNHAREGAEGCDDGNTRAGDGCSATCALEGGGGGGTAGGGSAGGGSAGGGSAGGGSAGGGSAGGGSAGGSAGGGSVGGGSAGGSAGGGSAGGGPVGGGSSAGGGTSGAAGGSAAAGGTAGGGSEPMATGCGCHGAGGSASGVLLAISLVLVERGRRSRRG
jgi:cysteine-rich repeat protein